MGHPAGLDCTPVQVGCLLWTTSI